MTNGKVVLGVALIISGIALFFIPVLGWIYGPIVIGIGIALIILRDSDSEMEPRNDLFTKQLKRAAS